MMGEVFQFRPPMPERLKTARATAARLASLLDYAGQPGNGHRALLRVVARLLADELGTAEATAFMGALNYEMRQGLLPPGPKGVA